MSSTLSKLLETTTPSKVIENNCIELIQREQVGTKKYGVTLTDAKISHEEVLQHLLEEQLDAANYTRKALLTSSAVREDYRKLKQAITNKINQLNRLDSLTLSELDASDVLEEILFQHELEKLKRDVQL